VAQHPFLKSIRPVNLLSFGPNTEEIELRALNFLIGPNGSGKSNLIEIVGLLSKLPDKDPWSTVIQTGGAREWIWKGKNVEHKTPSLSIVSAGKPYPIERPNIRSYGEDESGMLNAIKIEPTAFVEKPISYSVSLREQDGSFEVVTERFQEVDRWENDEIQPPWFERDGWLGKIENVKMGPDSPERLSSLPPQRSVLSMLGSANIITGHLFHIQEFAEDIGRFAFYRDWVFGSDSEIRDVQPVGLDSYRLARDSSNFAQVLKAWRDRGEQAVFDKLIALMQKFYEPIKDVDTELLGTHLRIMIKEDGLNSRTPASRLSDGTLRWLMLLIVLLDPAPPPVICIDEPELGLHPDMLPTLADLLVDASTRTQLIVTTHSDSLLDSFTETPEVVCVCEKVDGSTVIRRLDKERLKVWLGEYSLGKLWASGEIGGNRW